VTELHIVRPVDDTSLEGLRSLAEAAAATAGHPVLGDGVWRDLATPSARSALVRADDGNVLCGAMHLGPPDHEGVVTGSLVVAPGSRGQGIEAALVRAALADLEHRDLRRLEVWVFGDAGDPDRPLGPPFRELHQMRVALPLAGSDAAPAWPPGTGVRPFAPGADDAAWLTVNNRAFAADPDQGGWTLDTLRARIAEPWFDAAGFLLAEDAAGLAGFCWTKVHAPQPPFEPETLGEIYVIGVDPDRQGSGLGRALVVAGLAWLAEKGITIGMLFVDAANEPAVHLYEALGFTTSRTDRAYAFPVEPTP